MPLAEALVADQRLKRNSDFENVSVLIKLSTRIKMNYEINNGVVTFLNRYNAIKEWIDFLL